MWLEHVSVNLSNQCVEAIRKFDTLSLKRKLLNAESRPSWAILLEVLKTRMLREMWTAQAQFMRVHQAIRTLSGTGLRHLPGCLGRDLDPLCPCPENLSGGPISSAEEISRQGSIQAAARLLFVLIQVRHCKNVEQNNIQMSVLPRRQAPWAKTRNQGVYCKG